LSALRLLNGWNDVDNAAPNNAQLNSTHISTTQLEKDTLSRLENTNKLLFQQHCQQALEQTMSDIYGNLDKEQKTRLQNTLKENYKKILKYNIHQSLRTKFLEHENLLNSLITYSPELPLSTDTIEYTDDGVIITRNQATLPIYYSLLPQSECAPRTGHASAGIDIPIPTALTLKPNESKILDTGIQFYIHANFYMQLLPRSSTFKYNIRIHQGVIDNDFNGTIKLMILNTSNELLTIPANTALVQGLITPVIHPNLVQAKSICTLSERNNQFYGSSDAIAPRQIALKKTELSVIHCALNSCTPLQINIPEINSKISLPNDPHLAQAICMQLSELNKLHNMRNSLQTSPALTLPTCPEKIITDLTRQMIDAKAYLNSTNLVDGNNAKEKFRREIKLEMHLDMCKKLAVISVELIKNQSLTTNTIASMQEGDDIFSTIRQNIQNKDVKSRGFVIINQVLYKKFNVNNSKIERYALCLPAILMPSVIHQLHVTLGHPAQSTTLRNFQHYYYHPYAHNLIRTYVESCVTCALANKHDIQKVIPSTTRTMQPQRPRQHLYADLIPMFKGKYSYILFALDAYSQYIYAIPLKSKTSDDVLQGFLSIFGTTGWYENIYLDNETSFIKTSKLLVKIAPIKIHYSTPYCHFQNSAENYIKNFKRIFLKILNDQQNPQENADWPLLLPTVTQALNRQIIPQLGMSWETIHYNTTQNF